MLCSNILLSLVNSVLMCNLSISQKIKLSSCESYQVWVFNLNFLFLFSTKVVPWDFFLLNKIICYRMKLSMLSFCVCTLTAGTSRVFSPHVPASMAATGKYSLLTFFAITLNLDVQHLPLFWGRLQSKMNISADTRVLIVLSTCFV